MLNKNILNNRKFKGEVISVSADKKTIKVSLPRSVAHKTYGKISKLSTIVLADISLVLSVDIGSTVEVISSRKISKRKSWKIISVL